MIQFAASPFNKKRANCPSEHQTKQRTYTAHRTGSAGGGPRSPCTRGRHVAPAKSERGLRVSRTVLRACGHVVHGALPSGLCHHPGEEQAWLAEEMPHVCHTKRGRPLPNAQPAERPAAAAAVATAVVERNKHGARADASAAAPVAGIVPHVTAARRSYLVVVATSQKRKENPHTARASVCARPANARAEAQYIAAQQHGDSRATARLRRNRSTPDGAAARSRPLGTDLGARGG